MLWLLLANTWGDTPWNRPNSLRIIPKVPQNWEELMVQQYVDVRLFWDQHENAQIEMLSTRGWKILSTDASSGYTVQNVSLNSTFRIRLQSGIRYSPVQSITLWYNPRELLHIYQHNALATEPQIPKVPISELQIQNDHIWFSTLGYGLYSTDLSGKILSITNYFTRWNGLLSDQILSLDTIHNQIIIGSAQGSQLWSTSGELLQTWTSELPHPYTQRVYLDETKKIIGTYRGLYNPDTQETYLSPWSVFSMLQIDNILWVGYDGLQKLDFSTGEVSTINSDIGTVYDITRVGDFIYLSSKLGLYRIAHQKQDPDFEEITPYVGNLLYVENNMDKDQHPWFAVESDGLITPEAKIWREKSWHEDLQLSSVYSIAGHQDDGTKLFVGGKEGLRIISDPLQDNSQIHIPPSIDVWQPVGMNKNRYFFDWNYLYTVQENLPITQQLPSPIIDIHDQSIAMRDVIIQGSNTTITPPARLISATTWLSRLWVSTADGVYRYEEQIQAWKQQDYVPPMSDLQGSKEMLWGLGKDGIPYRIQPLKGYLRLHNSTSISPSQKTLCVLKEGDLYQILPLEEEDILEVYTPHDILAIAGDGQGGCYYVSEDGQIGQISSEREHRFGLVEEFTSVYNLTVDDQGLLWILSASGPYVVYPEHLR